MIKSLSCYPRPPKKSHDKRKFLKTPWDFFKSVFRDYTHDTTMLLNKCFEFDWEMCKIPRIIKNEGELELVKQYLKSNYKMLREIYKYYAAVSPAGNVFSIGSNVLNDIINTMGDLVDVQSLNLSDIDLEFVSTNAALK